MAVLYLTTRIAEKAYTTPPRPRLTRDGYTVRAGSPTTLMIRLEGETRWRRVMLWQFSNAGTAFVNIGGKPHVIPSGSL